LTLPGETLRDSVDAIFQQVEQALRITRDAVGYQGFKVSVGCIEDANLPCIALALIRFQALYPDITVERHEMNTAQQIAALKRNSIDPGFGLPAGSLLNDAQILTEPQLESSGVFLVRSDHRHANVDCLNLVDLVHERLITSTRAANAPLDDSIVAHFQSAGFRPNFVCETLQARAGTTLIEQGPGVVTGAINLFTSLPQKIKYRFINAWIRCRFECSRA
jgi:DNA-binding transcriptional LysR family regulator